MSPSTFSLACSLATLPPEEVGITSVGLLLRNVFSADVIESKVVEANKERVSDGISVISGSLEMT